MPGFPARVPAPRRRGGAESRRADNGVDARSAILAATERLLEERGLDQLTVVDVIEAAEVSRASFYMYFESKHAAVAALAETVLNEIVEEVWRPFLSGAEPFSEDVLTAHWRETLAGWSEHRAVLAAAAQGWRSHAAVYDHWGAAFRGYVDELAEHIERARAEADRGGAIAPGTRSGVANAPDAGGAHALDARTLAAVLIWQHENVLYLAVTGKEPEFENHERLAETLSAVWIRSVYGSI